MKKRKRYCAMFLLFFVTGLAESLSFFRVFKTSVLDPNFRVKKRI
jgi:hypothetical protein